MKKYLAIIVMAVMVLALAVSASANLNIDRFQVNADTLGADVPENKLPAEGEAKTINVGDKLYIIGWAYGENSNLKKIVYSLDDGADVACPDIYRDRADVAAAFGLDASFGVHAGFGEDQKDETQRGMLELPGVSDKPGTFVLHITAIYNDDTRESKDVNLVVEGEEKAADPGEQPAEQPQQNPPTADAAVIAIATVACIALAGVVVAKKVK